MNDSILETYVVDSAEQAKVLLNPLRGEILAHLYEPASATEVAKAINEAPQRVNYHLKALEKAELVKRVGTRQVRNLVEVLYQSIAKTFIMPESLGWSPEAVSRIKEQGALAHLVTVSERIKKDALTLLEQSEGDAEVPSASLQMKVSLPDEQKRNQFINEYSSMVKKLVEKYQPASASETIFNVLLTVYPEPDGGKTE